MANDVSELRSTSALQTKERPGAGHLPIECPSPNGMERKRTRQPEPKVGQSRRRASTIVVGDGILAIRTHRDATGRADDPQTWISISRPSQKALDPMQLTSRPGFDRPSRFATRHAIGIVARWPRLEDGVSTRVNITNVDSSVQAPRRLNGECPIWVKVRQPFQGDLPAALRSLFVET
jgi:hypothetical protein